MVTGDTDTFDQRRRIAGRDRFLVTDDDLSAIESSVREFLETVVADAGANGVVVAMSGGIDSTLTAVLAAEALGSDNVLGLGMPCSKTDGRHASEARTIADGLGIEFREIQLRPVLEAFESAVGSSLAPGGDVDATGNAIARLRMLCAYYAANAESRLVCGTSNRSELLLGYFTKYGDGAADLYPLGDLYKTEVRALARHVGVPRRIVHKDPTAGLAPGQTDASDLGATYDEIDPLLRRLVDHGQRIEDAVDDLAVDAETATDIASMYVDTLHKRTVPPTPGIGRRSDDRPSYALHLSEQLHQLPASDG